MSLVEVLISNWRFPISGLATPRGRGGHAPPPPFFFFFAQQKEKDGKKGKSRKDFKEEIITRLSPRLKFWILERHSRAPRIQNFFLSANHGGRQ